MIEKYFKPNGYARSVFDIDLNMLKKQGYNFIMCDIDNTLVAHDNKDPNELVFAFLKQCELLKFDIVFISNNNKKRVGYFGEQCKIDYYHFSTKPLKRQYKKILNKYQNDPSKVVVIGDQILTDILGGNRMKFYTILTDPLYQKDITWTKVNRIFEKIVYKKLADKKSLIKGEYYGV